MNSYFLIAKRLLFPRNNFRSNTINFISFIGLFIGAASIVAKVVRDKFMSMLDLVFPDFNFSKHKGYGTKEHFDLLKKNSFTEIHRKTFAPVKNLIKSRNCKDNNMNTSNTNLEEINVEINNWLRMIGLLN